MKILFVARTYHDGDNYLIKNKDLFKDKNYHEVVIEICNFYSNWLGEFYLLLKNDKKINIEIIFPDLKNLMDEILDQENRRKYDEYYNFIIHDFESDIAVFSGEYKYLYESIKKKNNQIALWKSSKINLKGIKKIKEYFDIIISDNQIILDLAQKVSMKSFYLQPSVPERIIPNFNFNNRRSDLFFSGSLGFDFKKRKKIINYLLKKKINFELRSRDITEGNKLKEFFFNKFRNFDFINSQRSIIKKMSKEPLFHLELFNYMKKFKYILNCHSDFDIDNTINYRVYESLACGSLLFTDQNKTLDKNFIDGKHLIVYKNNKDLLNKIKYFKKNESESEEIAKKGYEFVKEEHTSEKRVIKFKKIFNIN